MATAYSVLGGHRKAVTVVLSLDGARGALPPAGEGHSMTVTAAPLGTGFTN